MRILIGTALLAAALSVSSALGQTFKGYECTEDCSGHEAGYEWAERKGITSEYDCSGNSNSFNEGCQAWVEENNQDSGYSTEERPEEGEEPQ